MAEMPVSPNLCVNPLLTSSCSAALKTLMQVIQTCIGPNGKLKILKSTAGRSATVTSSSQRLFSLISVKHVFSKVIIFAAKSQLKQYNDCGLYCVLLILKLISNSLSLHYSLPLVGTLYEHFAKLYIECLKENNASIVNVDFSNLHHLKSVVSTLLSSKPGCVLTLEDKNHLCMLLLKAFLNVVPNDPSVPSKILDDFNVSFLTVEGISVKQSKLYSGALVRISKAKNFIAQCDRTGPLNVAVFTIQLDFSDPLRTCHVSGMKDIENLVKRLISKKVNIVFCQKVIHPRLKKQMQTAGIMALDRLGIETIKYIIYVSGGSINSSVYTEVSCGVLSSVKSTIIGQKSFLLVCNEDVPFFTLVLGHYNEEASSELEVVCRQTVDSLFRILKKPMVCFGSGCTEVFTAHLLAQKVKETVNEIQNEADCTFAQVLETLRVFLESITDMCVAIHQGTKLDFVTESINGHLWKLSDEQFPTAEARCECGRHSAANLDPSCWLFLSDIHSSIDFPLTQSTVDGTEFPVVLDEMSSKINSLSLAFENAALLLRTSVFINNLPQ